jgi:hypothetical protein
MLSKLAFPSEVVHTSGGALELRSLSFADMTALYSRHAARAEEAFAMVMPEIVADVIAFAAGEPEMASVALRLSPPVQLEAIEKIAKLTFKSEEDAKKVLEGVVRMMNVATNLLGAK